MISSLSTVEAQLFEKFRDLRTGLEEKEAKLSKARDEASVAKTRAELAEKMVES